MQTKFIWLDGSLVPWEQAKIHIMTHTLHYGTGAFEGIRCYATDKGPAMFRLADHVNRFFDSFAHFGKMIPWSKQEITQAIIDIVKANNLQNCYIRPLFFLGNESILVNQLGDLSVHCAISTIDINNIDMSEYVNAKGISVGISSLKRISPQAVPIHAKITGYYVNSILAYKETKERGFDEALLLDDEGNVAEGSVANIFFVIDDTLKTPPATHILKGITRESILTLAKKLNIPTKEEILTAHDITRATEAFFTGTMSEITLIARIDQTVFKQTPGPITQQLRSAFHKCIHNDDVTLQQWLTYIS